MYYFIVPRNESTGLKELRVSTLSYTFSHDGPLSGVSRKGLPIEALRFNSQTEARAAIEKAAPQYLP